MFILLCTKTGAIDGEYNNMPQKELKKLCDNLNHRHKKLGCDFKVFEYQGSDCFTFNRNLYHDEALKNKGG